MTTVNIFEKSKIRDRFVVSETLSNFDRYYRVNQNNRTVTIDLSQINPQENSGPFIVFLGQANDTLVIPKGWTLFLKTPSKVSLTQQLEFAGLIINAIDVTNKGTIRVQEDIILEDANQPISNTENTFIGIEIGLPNQDTLFLNQGQVITKTTFTLGRNSNKFSKKKNKAVPEANAFTFATFSVLTDALDNQGDIIYQLPEMVGYTQKELSAIINRFGTDEEQQPIFYPIIQLLNDNSITFSNTGNILFQPPTQLQPCQCQFRSPPSYALIFADAPDTTSVGNIVIYVNASVVTQSLSPEQVKFVKEWNITLSEGLQPNTRTAAKGIIYRYQQQSQKLPCCFQDQLQLQRLADRYQNFLDGIPTKI
jgi:hypothetical protein